MTRRLSPRTTGSSCTVDGPRPDPASASDPRGSPRSPSSPSQSMRVTDLPLAAVPRYDLPRRRRTGTRSTPVVERKVRAPQGRTPGNAR